MNQTKKMILAAVLILFSAGLVFSQMNGGGQGKRMEGRGYDKGPGMMKNSAFGEGPGFGEGPMMEAFLNPEVSNIVDSYKIKIEQVFLDAKKDRLGLVSKKRELVGRLQGLADKYQSDKAAGKELIAVLKELSTVQDKIHTINQVAMVKIRELNEAREKEIKQANDNWISKMEKDEKELDKFIYDVCNHPRRGQNR